MQGYYIEEVNWFYSSLCCMRNAVYAFPYESFHWFGSYCFIVVDWI